MAVCLYFVTWQQEILFLVVVMNVCVWLLCISLITVYDTNYKLVPYIRFFPSATTYIPDNHKIQGKQHQVNGIVAHPTK